MHSEKMFWWLDNIIADNYLDHCKHMANMWEHIIAAGCSFAINDDLKPH